MTGVVAILTAAGLAVTPWGQSGPSADFPDDQRLESFTSFTSEQLRESVVEFDGEVFIVPLTPAIEPLESERDEDGDRVVSLMSDILFDFGSADVRGGGQAGIEAALDDVPDGAGLEISGHTDSIGSDESNQELSERRAEAVAAIVRESRPDLDLTVVGHGESQPVEPNEIAGNDHPAGREKNRRVELRVE